MSYTILFRRGTALEWTNANSVLHLAELGFETDTKKIKIGDGTTPWNSLPYTLATLQNGKIPIDQIPDASKISVNQINSYAELASITAQSGDIAIDINSYKSYIYNGSSWLEIFATPVSASTSFATIFYVDNAIDNLNIETYPNSASVSNMIATAISELNFEDYAPYSYVNSQISNLNINRLNIIQSSDIDNSLVLGNQTPAIGASGGYYVYQNTTGIGDNVFPSASVLLNAYPSSRYAYDSTAVGSYSISYAIHNSENTAVGYNTLVGGGFKNVAVGNNALYNIQALPGDSRFSPEFSKENVAVGYNALYVNANGNGNIGIGAESLYNSASGSYNIGIGYGALKYYDNGNAFLGNNSIAIGASATVSASSQIKLGNSLQSTVTYGGIQNIADQRDVADVVNTTLGLSFINELRPVDFKWNYREDYEDFTSPGTNKKRNKIHHGLIAQEVKQAATNVGVSFGGHIDMSISGNVDIQMLTYQEFIPPIIKSIQQVDTRLISAENNLSTVAALSASVASLSAAYAELISQDNIVYETYTFSSSGTDYFVSASPGSPDPTMTLVKGRRYRFDMGLVNSSQPIALRVSDQVTNDVIGTTNNDPTSGISALSTSPYIFYSVPENPPYSSIIYQSVNTPSMGGVINLVDP